MVEFNVHGEAERIAASLARLFMHTMTGRDPRSRGAQGREYGIIGLRASQVRGEISAPVAADSLRNLILSMRQKHETHDAAQDQDTT
jgi:hypothetical protein